MTKSYTELYRRNWPIISVETQRKISQLRVGIAGCGSTGGGFIDGLLRLGVQCFHLTDTGDYELNNLNRQFVFRDDINKNKATVHGRRIQAVNSEAIVRVWTEGLTAKNVYDFVGDCDFVFDAVDVTTEAGMAMKLRLHEVLHEKKVPTGSALDLGYMQWLQSYNYHRDEKLLKGRFAAAKSCKNPLKALIAGFSPIEELTLEITEEVIRLIRDPNDSCCQLACVCYLLAAMVTPYMLGFIENGELPPLIMADLQQYFETKEKRQERKQKTEAAHRQLRDLLSATP